jgi:hypothetical protein
MQPIGALTHEGNTNQTKPIPYEKEMVEHLTDQLIKPQRSYDVSNNLSTKPEISHAMKTINKCLESVLFSRFIIK